MTQLARFLLEHPPTLWWIVYPLRPHVRRLGLAALGTGDRRLDPLGQPMNRRPRGSAGSEWDALLLAASVGYGLLLAEVIAHPAGFARLARSLWRCWYCAYPHPPWELERCGW